LTIEAISELVDDELRHVDDVDVGSVLDEAGAEVRLLGFP